MAMTSQLPKVSTPPKSATTRRNSRIIQRWVKRIFNWRLLLAPLLGYILYRFWLNKAESGDYPAFMLPHPQAVWERYQFLWERDLLIHHSQATLYEAVYGLLIASGFALVMGYLIARIHLLNYLLMPYLIFLQAIPVIAIAPFLIIWFGPDRDSKIAVAAFITWFPLMVATSVGIRNVSPNLRELMRANRANPFQVFWHLELPSALPEILGGFKVSATLAVIGAAVGEYVSSREGLGNLIVRAKGTHDSALLISAILLLTLLSLSLYTIVSIIEYMLLRWKRAGTV